MLTYHYHVDDESVAETIRIRDSDQEFLRLMTEIDEWTFSPRSLPAWYTAAFVLYMFETIAFAGK